MVTVVGLASDKVTTTLTSMLFITCIVCPLPLSRVTALNGVPWYFAGAPMWHPCAPNVHPRASHLRHIPMWHPCGTHVAPTCALLLKRDRPRTL